MGEGAVAIIAAIVAAAASAASAAQQAKAAARAKRSSANASQMAGSGVDTPTTPTANKFADNGSAKSLPSLPGTALGAGGQAGRLQDLLKGSTGSTQATQPQQGMSVGIKSDEAPPIPESRPFEVENAPNPPSIRTGEDLTMPKATTTPSTGSQINQYAQIAQSLYGAYDALKPRAPQPGPMPQLGPMNLRPTAYNFV